MAFPHGILVFRKTLFSHQFFHTLPHPRPSQEKSQESALSGNVPLPSRGEPTVSLSVSPTVLGSFPTTETRAFVLSNRSGVRAQHWGPVVKDGSHSLSPSPSTEATRSVA